MFPSPSLTVLCGLLQGRGKGRGCVLAITLQVTYMASGQDAGAYPGMQRPLFWTVGSKLTDAGRGSPLSTRASTPPYFLSSMILW